MANRIKQTLGTIIVGAGVIAAGFAGYKYLADVFGFKNNWIILNVGENTNSEYNGEVPKPWRGLEYCGMLNEKCFSLSKTSLFSRVNYYFPADSNSIKLNGVTYGVEWVNPNQISLSDFGNVKFR
jgi:hypothetical protein